MRHRFPLVTALLAASLAGAACAGPPAFDPLAPVPDQVEELREYFNEDTGDVEGRVDLAQALVVAERYADVLELTGDDAPEDHRADARLRLLRAMALEGTGELSTADSLYTDLLQDPGARASTSTV